MRQKKHNTISGLGLRRGSVLTPLSPLASMRRPRGGAFTPPGSLPNAVFYGETDTLGTAGSYDNTVNANPGSFPGTAPTWGATNPPAGLTGYLHFAGAPNTNRVAIPAYAVTGRTIVGVGKAGQGPAKTVRIKVRRTGTNSGYHLLWGDDAGNTALYCLNDTPSMYLGGDHSTGLALTLNVWVVLHVVFGPDDKVRVYQDGVLKTTFTYASGFNITCIGGANASPTLYAFAGDLADFAGWPRALSAAEVTADVAGTLPPVVMERYYPLDDGSGTAPRDATPVLVDASLVATFPDQTAHANDHTGAGSARPRSAFPPPAAPPLNHIPALDGGTELRFLDGGPTNLAKASPAGVGTETKFSGWLRGGVYDFYRGTTLFTYRELWRITGSGGHYISLGYQMGGPDFSGTFATRSRWVLTLYDGSTTKRVFGDRVHALPTALGFRWDGDAGYAEIWGAKPGGVAYLMHRETTGIPASLTLGGGSSEVSPTASPGGPRLRAMALGNAAWPDAVMASLISYWHARTRFPYIRVGEIHDGGGFSSGGDTSYVIGNNMCMSASGRVHDVYTAGPSDPSDTGVYHRWMDNPLDFASVYSSAITIAKDVTHANANWCFGNSLIRLTLGIHPNRLIATGGHNPYPAGGPSIAGYWYCDNPDDATPVWSAFNAYGAFAGYDEWFPHGPIYELGAGHLVQTFFGHRTVDTPGVYAIGLMESFDYGATQAILSTISTAAGATNEQFVEPTMMLLDGLNKIDVIARTGVTPRRSEGSAGGTVWTYPPHVGDNGVMPVSVEPFAFDPGDPLDGYLLFQGIRQYTNLAYDETMRYGLVVSRVVDGTVSEQVLLAPELDGINYSGGVVLSTVDGHVVMRVSWTADDGRLNFLDFEPELIPVPIT